MIPTDITRSTIDAVDRSRTLGTSGRATVWAVMSATKNTSAAYGTTAELRASSFAGGHVCFRPAALDVLVPTTPGHLAWSPPT